ncbi:tetratricopeptide repeat protein [Paracoccaceae bacterium]|nr:tetratricopeptide repeat protein [Paracoccaceae bacterium]
MTLPVNKALRKAQSYIKAGELAEAEQLYKQVLSKFPKNKKANQGYQKLKAGITSNRSSSSKPPQEKVQELVDLYNQGQFKEVLEKAKPLISLFPRVDIFYNLTAASHGRLKNLDQAIENFNKVLELNPKDAIAYFNIATIFLEQKKFDLAIENYQKCLIIKPNHAEAYDNMGSALKAQSNFNEAIQQFTQAINLKPNFAQAHYNLGVVLQEAGNPEAAITSHEKACEIRPSFFKAYLAMGNVLHDKSQLDAAIDSYKQAIKIKPDYANAYSNMGNVLRDKGELDAAIDSYKQAIMIKPDYAEAYSNMGNALHNKGELNAAIDSYEQAIKIKPDYAEAYNNMGNVLHDKGELNAAIDSYEQAIKIKPDYAEAYWNLSGTAGDMVEAKNWLKECLKFDDSHVLAKLTLAALNFYEGNEEEFDTFINTSLWDHPYTRSFSWVFSLPELPKLYFTREQLFDFISEGATHSRPFYEYGVWRGQSFKYLIKTFKKGYGFDTFEGLPEDWHSQKAGTYSSDGNIPKVDGGEFIQGKFEDTLPEFFSVQRPVASVINFDADLYSSTICALNYSKSVIDGNTILIFDEFIINEYWEEDEYKALEEFCSENNFSYEVLAVSFYTKQVAVKLLMHD